jgi:predicted ATPase
MLIVTGTPRSGTSMWMQILVAAGFDAIGEPFPGDWHALLSSANQDGYWESQLLGGVYYRTNPHPLTGAFLFPEQTRFHAVKILVPGLLRSDLAYIDRVVGTVREWREFAASRVRLRELYESHFGIAGTAGLEPHEQILRHELPPALEWWVDNFALLRDLATRRYAAHVCSYQSLIEDPERAIGEVLRWLDRGDLARAVAAVRPERQTQRAASLAVAPSDATPGDSLGVEAQDIEVFDELYDHIHRGHALSAAFLAKLNDTDVRLRPRLLAHEAQARVSAARAMLAEADAQSQSHE